PDDDFVLPEGECRLDTVSVLPRRRAHRVPHREGGIAQRILQVRPHQPRLVPQLRRIREVLPLAASTHAEVPARGGRGVSGLPDPTRLFHERSFSRSSLFTSSGLARPRLFFITWPTRKVNACVFPARTSDTGSGCSVRTSSTRRPSDTSSLICATPRSPTINSGRRPWASISPRISFAVRPLIAPRSIS